MTPDARLSTNTFWQEKRVVVTGGAGFLGSNVVRKLRERGCEHIFERHGDRDTLLARRLSSPVPREPRGELAVHDLDHVHILVALSKERAHRRARLWTEPHDLHRQVTAH